MSEDVVICVRWDSEGYLVPGSKRVECSEGCGHDVAVSPASQPIIGDGARAVCMECILAKATGNGG